MSIRKRSKGGRRFSLGPESGRTSFTDREAPGSARFAFQAGSTAHPHQANVCGACGCWALTWATVTCPALLCPRDSLSSITHADHLLNFITQAPCARLLRGEGFGGEGRVVQA